MIKKSTVIMIPGDIRHNYVELLLRKGLLKKETATDQEIAGIESHIRMYITKFTIMSELWGNVSAEVGEGKYKTALLLLYLAELHKKSSFQMDEDSRVLAMHYYTVEVVRDALSNPDTAHQSVRALLSPGFVQVNCLA